MKVLRRCWACRDEYEGTEHGSPYCKKHRGKRPLVTASGPELELDVKVRRTKREHKRYMRQQRRKRKQERSKVFAENTDRRHRWKKKP